MTGATAIAVSGRDDVRFQVTAQATGTGGAAANVTANAGRLARAAAFGFLPGHSMIAPEGRVPSLPIP